VLHNLLRVIAAHLRRRSDAGPHARFGAVSFIHRFGAVVSLLNPQTTAKIRRPSSTGGLKIGWFRAVGG